MADETLLAALVAAYYRREIGVLMHQAEHWAQHGKPLAVHHRVMQADSFFQIVALMERDPKKGWDPPFEEIRKALERPIMGIAGKTVETGTYPPSIELHAYRDPRFVVHKLEELKRQGR